MPEPDAILPPADDWLAALARWREDGLPCVLVTVAETEGSAPRAGGAKMLVGRERQVGSIGGGHLELRASEIARAMLAAAAPSGPHLETFSLGPQLGQCCGGRVRLLFEPFVPAPFAVAIFGAGHVGKALVHVLAGIPARIRWIDSRADQFPAALPANVEKLVSERPEDEVPDLAPGSFALVMTHSHDLDLALCERLVRRGDCRYVGLIGSASKRRRFESRMIDRGLDPARVRAIRCPIGVAGISGKHPSEIAIAVAAELLVERERSSTRAAAAPAAR